MFYDHTKIFLLNNIEFLCIEILLVHNRSNLYLFSYEFAFLLVVYNKIFGLLGKTEAESYIINVQECQCVNTNCKQDSQLWYALSKPSRGRRLVNHVNLLNASRNTQLHLQFGTVGAHWITREGIPAESNTHFNSTYAMCRLS